MAGLEVMSPLFQELDANLNLYEKEKSYEQLTSVYCKNYDGQKTLLALLQRLALENKITPTNTVPLREGLLIGPKEKALIGGIIDRYSKENDGAIKEWSGKQPSEFIGRDPNWLRVKFKSNKAVLVWGSAGVGKTTLAREFMKMQKLAKNIVVDLRGITSMQVALIETLKCFGKIVSIEDSSVGLVTAVVREIFHETLLLFDNADDFIHYSGEGTDHTAEYISFLKEIVENSGSLLKLLITSRKKIEHTDTSFLHQDELAILDDDAASTIIKSRMIHEEDRDSTRKKEVIMEAVRKCKNLPLNLNILGASLQEQGVNLESLLPFIMQQAQQWIKQKARENVTIPEEDSYTFAVLDSGFKQLSDTTQLSAVALSLFTRTFSMKSVTEILKGYNESKVNLILNHLTGTKFVNCISAGVYEMHPKTREFLINKISSSSEIEEFFLRSKAHFISYHKALLVNIATFIDDDYLNAYDLYQESSSDFEFIFKEKDNDMVLVDSYDDNQLIASLLHGMLEPSRRIELYRNLADNACKNGKMLLAAHHIAQLAEEESFHNPVEAFDYTLLRVQHMLETLKRQHVYQKKDNFLNEIDGWYQYVKADLLYKIARSSFSISDCISGVDAVKKSIEMREKLHPGGHSDTVRSYINAGNLYNMMEDIHRVNEHEDETERCLGTALEYYMKASELRLRLSNGRAHIDLPQILVNIGTIWNERGRLIQERERQAGRRALNETARTCFKKAEEFFEKSLAMEVELKLDGLFETSVKYINLGDLQRNLQENEKALDSFAKALEIRRVLKGDHKDTVLTLYRLAVSYQNIRDYKSASLYYKEAFEMEERLPDNYHSSVRFDIRRYLPGAYMMWARKEKDEEEAIRIDKEREDLEKRFQELQMPIPSMIGGAEEATSASRPRIIERNKLITHIRHVDGEFDMNGGHVPFLYYNVYLTLPRNLTERERVVRLGHVEDGEEINMTLNDAELLVSPVIDVTSDDFFSLKTPAMLEIQCDIISSRIGKFSELAMIQYDDASRTWTTVEKFEILHKRFYWYNENERVPIIQAWIKQFTMFAVVLRPKTEQVLLPDSGLEWKPTEYGRTSINFPPGCLSSTSSTLCSIKVVIPEDDLISTALESHGLLFSPVLNVDVKEGDIVKPIKLYLPLLGKAKSSEGYVKILKKDDDTAASLRIHEVESILIDEKENVVQVEVSDFSWIMAIWTLSKEVSTETLDWATDVIFRYFRYNVEVSVYKKIFVSDSGIVGVSCTPLTTRQSGLDEQRELASRMGYKFFISSSSLEKLYDGTLLRVDVGGQYINKCRPSDVDFLRFDCKDTSPRPIALKKGGLDEDGGFIVLETDVGKKRICRIPYMKDFKLVSHVVSEEAPHVGTSDSKGEHDRKMYEAPLRFLGLRLDACGLKHMNVPASDFRNNLYRTGLHEAFIDELKLDSNYISRQELVRKLLERITLLFVDDKLAPDWFSVFEEHLHPPHVRNNLTQVMNALKVPSWPGGQSLHPGMAHILLQNLNRSPLHGLLDPGTLRSVHSNPPLEFVRFFLCLKRDGYEEEVDNLLDCIGADIERIIKIEY